ncbi:MAG TPA: hypothetical protein VNN79_18090 [Actinomycetota bacterium]|nr:hypothetical protein [Actinomycetota bacterium]
MFPCAYLRVFQPLSAFPTHERAHWERYIMAGGRTPPLRPIYRERPTVPEGRIGLLSSAEGDHADVRTVDGEVFVCPWRTRLRELASLLSLRESTAPEMVDAFVPESEARRAARELARLRRRGPAAVPFLLQSPWHVPIRWFVLVTEEERFLAEDPVVGYRLTYRTDVTKARKRAEVALVALRRSELSPLAELAGDLSRWLAAFDPRSVLELDYDGVSSLFSWDELDNDHSAGEVQESVRSLSEGDLARAVELYQSVSNRWAEVRSHESLN